MSDFQIQVYEDYINQIYRSIYNEHFKAELLNVLTIPVFYDNRYL